MIRKLLITCVAIMSIGVAQAQNFRLNDQVINVGLGFGSYHYGSSYYHLSVPPLSVSFEKGIRDNIFDKGVLGIGAMAGFSSHTYEWGNYSSRLTSLFVGGRGIVHYPIIEDNKIDTYGGLMLGLHYSSFDDNNNILPSVGTGLGWSLFIGGRYYFTEQLGGMLELGYGLTYLNLGLALKL